VELRDWAISILAADTIEAKLFVPEILTDEMPGPPILWDEPSRPSGMSFTRRTKEDKLPPFHEHNHPDKIAICLHRFAGHELLAVEIMAYTLLAYPDAPKNFRKGLAHTLKEEQMHVRLYVNRLAELNVQFGDMPLYRHFWKHTPYINSPLDYVCMMSLTFEMANLDFAPMYGNSFARNGDQASADLMAKILSDEIQHVGFGWNWLKRLKATDQTEWTVWEKSLTSTLLTPKRAKGFVLNEKPRQQAGIPAEWITQLKKF